MDQTSSLTEAILDSVAEGVFTVDQDLRIAYWNKTAVYGLLFRASALRDRDGVFMGGVEAFRELTPKEGDRNADRDIGISQSVEGLVSRSPSMKRILGILPAVAQSDTPVLIIGSSGSGKRSVAQAIHRLSHSAPGPLVILSCAAFSDELQEAEVAGRLPREETGPAHLRASASGGTLILNELADLTPTAQLKLLRVLQHDEFHTESSVPDGSPRTRLISTSGHDLAEAVRKGRFREDLFYRLAVITLDIPNLRERLEDVPLLAERFVDRHARRSGRLAGITLSAEALKVLQVHDFPGNVRELENIIEHALTVSRSAVISVEDLPGYLLRHVSSSPSLPSLDSETSDRVSDEAILDTIAEHKGNKSRPAKELGIHRSTLWRRMKKLGIDK
jgi:DNA-binding NtrC family response regulator